MESKPKGQRRVKLMEVMVALAVIVIVAAIVFPIFVRVRDGGHEPSCASNMKQLGLGFIQYIQDYDEKWPIGTQTTYVLPTSQPTGVGWGGQIYTYVKSRYLYQCFLEASSKTPTHIVSYAYNSNIASLWGKNGQWALADDPIKTVVLFEVSNAAADVTQVDEGAAHGAAVFSPAGNGLDGYLLSAGNGGRGSAQYATGYLCDRIPAPEPGQFTGSDGRHKINSDFGSFFLLADGHVKWFRPDQVSSG